MRTLIVAALCLTAGVAFAGKHPKWNIEAIGEPGLTFAEAVNNRGDVTGWKYIFSPAPYHRAFVWQNGTVVDLGVPPGWTDTDAIAVNNGGTAVANSNSSRIAIWKDGAWTVTSIFGFAFDINEGGTISGQYVAGNGLHAFTYKDGALNDLGTLGGATSFGRSINSSGTVAGYSALAGNPYLHAFVSEHGAMRDLGTLGGNYSWAYGINNRGTVVGGSTNAAGNIIAMIAEGGVMRPLLATGTTSFAMAINNSGQVVGTVDSGSFLYDDGLVLFLEAIPAVAADGWTRLTPYAISDRGWIVGVGTRAGSARAFVLKPKD